MPTRKETKWNQTTLQTRNNNLQNRSQRDKEANSAMTLQRRYNDFPNPTPTRQTANSANDTRIKNDFQNGCQ